MDVFNDKNIKGLPRDEKGGFQTFFEANGNKYKICFFEENGLPIDRWSAYENWALMFTYNASPAELIENNRKTGEMLNRIMAGDKTINVLDVVAHQKSIVDGIITLSNQKFTRAMYLCSLFILREGEDATVYNHALAEAKIMDWIKEGYAVNDFFTLAQTVSTTYTKNLIEFIRIGLSENNDRPIVKDDGTEIGKL